MSDPTVPDPYRNPSAQVESWKAEERQPFTGWEFSYLDGRMVEEEPPWSYQQRTNELMRQAGSVLDMGTGGGERLLENEKYWPQTIVATEDYAPNALLAAERLAPECAVVVAHLSGDEYLPFVDGSFDVAINRHSAFRAQEVARILRPSGVFYTQQVHGLWAADLLAHFGAQPQWPDSILEKQAPALVDAGLTIKNAEQWSGRLCFSDVGAIVYYLKAVPWLVPGFSVERHLDALLRLQTKIERNETLVFLIRKYVIEAHKPQ